eukprot:764091-Hanusia_phi.AAC.20
MDRDSIQAAFDDLDALVILTSGVPKLRKREIVKTVLSKLIGRQRMPKFYYDQMPEEVDWLGCKCQIDLAKEKGIEHVVLVSSMGVSPQKNTPDNTLNKIGGGNILVWKAKAEDYLKESGLTYTIIHPGGLTNKPGGERELVLGTDDSLLDNYEQLGIAAVLPCLLLVSVSSFLPFPCILCSLASLPSNCPLSFLSHLVIPFTPVSSFFPFATSFALLSSLLSFCLGEQLSETDQTGATRTIPREDVANLVIEVLRHKELVANKSFDVVTKDVGVGTPTKDWESLFKTLP